MTSRRAIAGALVALAVLAMAGPSSRADAQQPDMAIAIDDGRITASIRNHSLRSVLEQLGSRTGVMLVPADDIDPRSRVSVELTGVALDEGLRRLLANYDTFFYYAAAGSGASSLRTVWIYPKGTAAGLRPVPPDAWAGTKELQASLADADPEVRARTYEALIARPTPESRELVLHALRGTSESDSTVRERILSSAFSSGMQLPADLLTYLARWDAHEGIRLIALDGLALEPTFKETAQAALMDPSPRVRKRAKEILAELEPR
jgi:hypothetical protein